MSGSNFNFLDLNNRARMDCTLLDKYTISLITSPNKQFYHVTAIDSSDVESCVPFDVDPPENSIDRYSYNLANGLSLECNSDDSTEFLSGGKQVEETRSSDSVSETISESKTSRDESDVCSRPSSVDSFSDGFSESSSNCFEGTLGAAIAVRQSTPSLSEAQLNVRKDVVRASSLAQLFNPAYAGKLRHRSESHLSSSVEKSRKQLKKRDRKSKSTQNNYFNGESSSRTDSVCKALFQSFHSQSKSSTSTVRCDDTEVDCRLNINEAGYCQSSGNEELPTSDCIVSTGQESTAIDQAWDGYQVPLYIGISDDSSEEKLDAAFLQDWQPLTDEVTDVSDSGDYSRGHHKKKPKPTEQDSDTDVEELSHFLKVSSNSLRLTRSSIAAYQLDNGYQRTCHVKELQATCETNLNCLRDLLAVIGMTDQLSDLLRQWEDVRDDLLQLTCSQDISISKSASDVTIDLSPDDITVCEKKIDIFPDSSNSDESELSVLTQCDSRNTEPKRFNRFHSFSKNLYNLVHESNSTLVSAFTSIQPLLFVILLFFLATYIVVRRECWNNFMEIKFEPQLRYVIGPPPS